MEKGFKGFVRSQEQIDTDIANKEMVKFQLDNLRAMWREVMRVRGNVGISRKEGAKLQKEADESLPGYSQFRIQAKALQQEMIQSFESQEKKDRKEDQTGKKRKESGATAEKILDFDNKLERIRNEYNKIVSFAEINGLSKKPSNEDLANTSDSVQTLSESDYKKIRPSLVGKLIDGGYSPEKAEELVDLFLDKIDFQDEVKAAADAKRIIHNLEHSIKNKQDGSTDEEKVRNNEGELVPYDVDSEKDSTQEDVSEEDLYNKLRQQIESEPDVAGARVSKDFRLRALDRAFKVYSNNLQRIESVENITADEESDLKTQAETQWEAAKSLAEQGVDELEKTHEALAVATESYREKEKAYLAVHEARLRGDVGIDVKDQENKKSDLNEAISEMAGLQRNILKTQAAMRGIPLSDEAVSAGVAQRYFRDSWRARAQKEAEIAEQFPQKKGRVMSALQKITTPFAAAGKKIASGYEKVTKNWSPETKKKVRWGIRAGVVVTTGVVAGVASGGLVGLIAGGAQAARIGAGMVGGVAGSASGEWFSSKKINKRALGVELNRKILRGAAKKSDGAVGDWASLEEAVLTADQRLSRAEKNKKYYMTGGAVAGGLLGAGIYAGVDAVTNVTEIDDAASDSPGASDNSSTEAPATGTERKDFDTESGTDESVKGEDALGNTLGDPAIHDPNFKDIIDSESALDKMEPTPQQESGPEIIPNIYEVSKGDNIWKIMEGRAVGIDTSEILNSIPKEHQDAALMKLRAEINASAELREEIGMKSTDADLIYPGEKLNVHALDAELQKIAVKEGWIETADAVPDSDIRPPTMSESIPEVSENITPDIAKDFLKQEGFSDNQAQYLANEFSEIIDDREITLGSSESSVLLDNINKRELVIDLLDDGLLGDQASFRALYDVPVSALNSADSMMSFLDEYSGLRPVEYEYAASVLSELYDGGLLKNISPDATFRDVLLQLVEEKRIEILDGALESSPRVKINPIIPKTA